MSSNCYTGYPACDNTPTGDELKLFLSARTLVRYSIENDYHVKYIAFDDDHLRLLNVVPHPWSLHISITHRVLLVCSAPTIDSLL